MRIRALVKLEAVGLGLTACLNVRLKKPTESHQRAPWATTAVPV